MVKISSNTMLLLTYFSIATLFVIYQIRDVYCSNELPAIEEITYKDMWGFEVNWTSSLDGWTVTKQRALLKSVEEMKNQISRVPHFTEVGYEIMKMDETFHEKLKGHINYSDVSDEGNMQGYS